MRKFMLVAAVLAAAVLPVASSASTAGVNIVHLSAPVSGLRYDQKTVHAHHGKVEIIFLNRSSIKHNVNVEQGEHELGKTQTVSHGTVKVTVTLKAGKYNYYCSVPGHEDAGMHGTLIVS